MSCGDLDLRQLSWPASEVKPWLCWVWGRLPFSGSLQSLCVSHQQPLRWILPRQSLTRRMSIQTQSRLLRKVTHSQSVVSTVDGYYDWYVSFMGSPIVGGVLSFGLKPCVQTYRNWLVSLLWSGWTTSHCQKCHRLFDVILSAQVMWEDQIRLWCVVVYRVVYNVPLAPRVVGWSSLVGSDI